MTREGFGPNSKNRHNNHHAFPASARHGFGWQVDLSYCVIRAMAAVGLAWKVRLPASYRGDG